MNKEKEYNPSTCGPIHTEYDGPHKRPIPYDDGLWYRKFQSWTDEKGKEIGIWKWVRNRND